MFKIQLGGAGSVRREESQCHTFTCDAFLTFISLLLKKEKPPCHACESILWQTLPTANQKPNYDPLTNNLIQTTLRNKQNKKPQNWLTRQISLIRREPLTHHQHGPKVVKVKLEVLIHSHCSPTKTLGTHSDKFVQHKHKFAQNKQ